MRADEKRYLPTAVLATLLLILCVICITILQQKRRVIIETEIETETVTVTETVYIYVKDDPLPEIKTEIREERWTVRAYEGKIGIFDEAEALVEVIEVYTKTLPETDRRLLEEGFEVFSKSELNALIQDYTG